MRIRFNPWFVGTCFFGLAFWVSVYFAAKWLLR